MSTDYNSLIEVQNALINSNTQVLELQGQLKEMWEEKARRPISKKSAQYISKAKSERCKALLYSVGLPDSPNMHTSLMKELQEYLCLANVIPRTMYEGLEVNVPAAFTLIKGWEPSEGIRKWAEQYSAKKKKRVMADTSSATSSDVYHYGVNYFGNTARTV